MRLYLTAQQEARLAHLNEQAALSKQAVQLYLQGIFDAEGMDRPEGVKAGRDDDNERFFLEWSDEDEVHETK
jgi:hypothetical protein